MSEIGVLAVCVAVRVHDRSQVLGDGHAGHRDRVLEGHEQTHPGALVRIGVGDVLALPDDLAVGHLEARMPHDCVGERRLAGPVGSHQGVDLALVDDEVEAAQDLLLTGADVEISDL